METEKKEHRKRYFSERNYAAPFGRYQSGNELGAPNEVLVGREDQRASFIEMLLRMGQRGAYLVTGQRGVGKSSFVHYCLAEYKEEIYERFLRSGVGRVMFWDHAGVLLLAFCIIFVMLLISELMEIVAFSTGWGKGDDPDILFGLVIIPLAVICLYPLLYARGVLEKVIETGGSKLRSKGPGLLATSGIVILALLIFFLPPFGAPALSMSRLTLAFCWIYLWIQATSFNRTGEVTPWWNRLVPWLSAPLALTLVFLGPLINLLFPETWLPGADQEFYGDLLWGAMLLGGGLVLRGTYLSRAVPNRKTPTESDKPAHQWYRDAGLLVMVSTAALFLLMIWKSKACWLSLAAACLCVLGAAGAFLLHCRNTRNSCPPAHCFRPRPRVVLVAKAFLSVAVTLQLIHPVFDKWTPALKGGSFEDSDRRPATALAKISSSQEGEHKNSVVFHGRAEELSWMVALFLGLAVLYFMEYEWIVRPFVKEREDGALDKVARAAWEDKQPDAAIDRQGYRELARMTLPWMLYDRWLPVLTVSVNLGFEKLDHRRVVHAMLAGLRDQYHRAFCAWNSGMANLGRLFGFLLLMMFVTLAGERWFSMPSLERVQNTTFAQEEYSKICHLFQGRQIGAGMANWICKMKWGDSIVHVLYYNLFDSSRDLAASDRKRHLLFTVFPYNEKDWPAEALRNGQEPFLKRGIQLRVYHLVLFLLFFFGGRWVLSRVPLLPYRELLRRIDDTMDSLAARTSVTSTLGSWKPAQWLQGFFMDERVRQTEQDPVDPRTVEFVFLQILRDIQGASIQLPGGRQQLVSLPSPEINFVLDELDKIGTRVDPDEATSSGGAQQAEIINAERRRSMELHRLLADMKNLLSSAPARFIFVGGRNLHDEWLADQTSRQPLLTNIFTAEVYLPSLLTDASGQRDEKPALSFQVEQYVANQKKRAEDLYHRSWRKRWLPMVALPLELRERESFLQLDSREPETGGKGLQMSLYSTDPKKEGEKIAKEDLCFPGGDELVEDFLQFLTYRSLGNSKKLKELLATFVRPAGRVVRDPESRWKEFSECDHVLFFGDTERFRIQLLARVYRHLTAHFEQALVRRDDKLAASVLYLADFLFKFHRRAFAWSSLERADELVHIHRAPDLREILEAIVVQWSERFLHPIRNGMYDFRFRSDMAREIEYVSRQSAEEMAAFNFTLDESQTLKAAYETNIARLGNSKEAQDLVSGLGELHEFDQEYETARLYYRRAISMLDAELEEVIGSSPETSRIEIIGGVPKGQEKARRYMTWGIARLRLMLQIGMTFEHSRNLERAEMEYQNARTLADSLLLAMLDEEGRRALAPSLEEEDEVGGGNRLHALKHLNILFQPLFAEIWVAEKLAGGVDTSTSLAEKELWRLRCGLPFVREPKLLFSESPTEVRGSNFALIATELHNKSGDLYFIKGRQIPAFQNQRDVKERFKSESGSGGLEGYLLRAHYHYAVGLHEMRRFVTHRRRSSEYKLALGRKVPTIVEGGWPDFVFRAIGGGFNDLAECLLGRLSLLALLREWRDAGARSAPVSMEDDVERLVRTCTCWLEGTPREKVDVSKLSELVPLDRMHLWVGRWCEERPAWSSELLTFETVPGTGTSETLKVSLGFSFVGARYLEQGGYLEDAGREMLKVCETVNYLLWWGLVARDVGGLNLGQAPWVWDYLFDVGLYALRQADRLFRSSRQVGGEKAWSLIGRKIPVAALTQACALGLAACRWDVSGKVQSGLIELLGGWLDQLPYKLNKDGFGRGLRFLLEESLVRYGYPMINRLHALRLLIDDTILGGVEEKRLESWVSELLDLENLLKAPLHFTPLHSGTTCALLVLRHRTEDREHRKHAAERSLVASQEMYSMRRAFYENISDLYYLYDDFNDRQLHFNHAIQMAGAELAALLRYQLNRRPETALVKVSRG